MTFAHPAVFPPTNSPPILPPSCVKLFSHREPKSSGTKTKSLYDVRPGVSMVQKWIADLKPKTGRSLEEWIALAKKEVPKKVKPVRLG